MVTILAHKDLISLICTYIALIEWSEHLMFHFVIVDSLLSVLPVLKLAHIKAIVSNIHYLRRISIRRKWRLSKYLALSLDICPQNTKESLF